MQYTGIAQKCYSVTLDPSTSEHRIETTVNTPGELPLTAIFVFTIGASNLPSTDSFSRVAQPQDLQNLKNNRENAIAAGDTEYLSSYAELKYTDMNVAVQAKAMMRTRINELINGWLTYRDQFTVDSNTDILFPSVDPAVEEALIQAYTDAKSARVAAEANVATKTAAVTTAQNAVTSAQETHAIYLAFLEYHTLLQSQINHYNGEISVPGASAIAYWNDPLNPAITAEQTLLKSQELYAKRAITAAQSNANTAVQDKAQADQELIAAQAAENAALAAVLAVLPTFDPATV